jgi:16S rRNA (uracil1498-N3)-methyltransferase
MASRFFIEGVHAVGARVAFAADDAHKLTTVLRKRGGDEVEVVDSAGVAYRARLEIAGRAAAADLIAAIEQPRADTTFSVTIAQAIPKGAKMDYVIEKATELGAAAIVPVISARVIGGERGEGKIERWRRIAKTAAQQSGRTTIPIVHDPISWAQLIATFATYDRVYVPWELAPHEPLRAIFDAQIPTARSVLVTIGPEGGFGADEVALATAAGATTISLGQRILRTETAALVVLSMLAYARGD